MDPEIQKAAELLFAQRRRIYQSSLARSDGRDDDTSSSAMARGAHLAELGRKLQEHCRQVLSDYISLLELFSALDASDGVRETFDTYVDDIASDLCRTSGVDGRAGHNRVANQVSSIKSEAGAELRRTIERATRAAVLAAAEGNEGDALDDRLPLRRRGAFDRDLDQLADRAKRAGGTFALVMVDIDHFKRVNDDHGHPVGDEVLLSVASAVVDRLAHKGTAYRYGGEEFALLLPSYTAEEACGLAERIRRDIERTTVSSKELRVTASFGVASIPEQANDARTLLEQADAALYRAKTAGRNAVVSSAGTSSE